MISYEKSNDIYSRGADLLHNYCDYYYLTMLVIYEHFLFIFYFTLSHLLYEGDQGAAWYVYIPFLKRMNTEQTNKITNVR